MVKNKTLQDYITDAKKGIYFALPTPAFSAICIAYPEFNNNMHTFDDIALNMVWDHCGADIMYTWIEYDGKIGVCSRQEVKYGRKPGSYDGEDLKPYITKMEGKA